MRALVCQFGMWTKQQKDWMSISPVLIYWKDLTGMPANDTWISLSSHIPAHANEVSLSFYVESGNVNCDRSINFFVKGFNKFGEVYRMLTSHLYYQNAWTFSNASMDLPTLNNRHVVSHPLI